MGFHVNTKRAPLIDVGLGFSLHRGRGGGQVSRYHAPLFGVLALAAIGLLSGCKTLESLNFPWQNPDTASDPERIAASTKRSLAARAQRGLVALGYRPGPADGVPGRKTSAAIRAYQKKAGLRVDGMVSRDLVEHIEDAAGELPPAAKAVGRHDASPPSYEVGSTFVYSDGRVDTVAGLKGDLVRWIRNDGTKFTAHRNFLLPWYYWQSEAESGTATLAGEPEVLWPRRTGREHRFSIKTMVQKSAGSDSLADWTEVWRCRFRGSEQVTVVAGRFETVKLTCSRDATDSRPALERTWHYAPDIGHYVRVTDASSGSRKKQQTDLVAIRPSGETWPPIARAALGRAVEQALNSAKNGEERPWTSSGVTTRVTIKPTSGFRELDGRRCRSFLQTWAGSGGRHRYPGAACQDPSGRWRIPGLEEIGNETLAISGGIS